VELIDVLHVLRRRLTLIAVVLVACLAGAAFATLHQTKTYRTSTKLIVSGASDVSAVDEITRRQLATQRAVAYSQIAATPPAIRAAMAAAVATGSVTSGTPSVRADATGDDPFLTITVTDSDPRRAAAVANAYVGVLPEVIKRLESTPGTIGSSLSTLSSAPVPSTAFSPRPMRNGLIGLVAGLVLGVGGAFVREALDRRLRDSDEVEVAGGVPVLGVVPQEDMDSHLPVDTHPMSSRAEAYRKIRTNLTFTSHEGLPASVLITSSTSGEGKTTLAANLALACARTGQRVLLIDADLRRPMIGEYLGLSGETGLTNWLVGGSDFEQIVQPLGDTGVDVITSGPIPANPSELLGSSRMSALLSLGEERYDIVIADAPPVLPVADGLVLAVHMRSVILVAKVGETTRDRLRRSRDAVLKVGGNLVGVVPNAVVQKEDSAYAYAYRYRSRGGADSLHLYTRQARMPEIDEAGRPLPEGSSPKRRGRFGAASRTR
jgi:capsular exopolysaccharide synthesis family protein